MGMIPFQAPLLAAEYLTRIDSSKFLDLFDNEVNGFADIGINYNDFKELSEIIAYKRKQLSEEYDALEKVFDDLEASLELENGRQLVIK